MGHPVMHPIDHSFAAKAEAERAGPVDGSHIEVGTVPDDFGAEVEARLVVGELRTRLLGHKMRRQPERSQNLLIRLVTPEDRVHKRQSLDHSIARRRKPCKPERL